MFFRRLNMFAESNAKHVFPFVNFTKAFAKHFEQELEGFTIVSLPAGLVTWSLLDMKRNYNKAYKSSSPVLKRER
jgi:hypothetical protein